MSWTTRDSPFSLTLRRQGTTKRTHDCRMTFPNLQTWLLMLAGLIPALNAQDWDWEYRLDSMFQTNASDYIAELANARRFSEGAIEYWCAAEGYKQARITQRFAFTNVIAQAHLELNSLYAANFSKDIHGQASLWASPDGLTWSRLLNIPRPTIPTVSLSYAGLLPPSLTGGRELWIQARLLSHDWKNAAQFLRRDRNQPAKALLSLQIQLAESLQDQTGPALPSGPRRAVATVSINDGKVTDVALMDAGQGYSTPPLISVFGNNGNGAILAADLEDGRLKGIRVIDPGSNYEHPVRIYISAPPYRPVPTVPGHAYQMYSTTDLLEWRPEGQVFTAHGTTVIQEFEVDDEGRIYQICHLLDFAIAQ
jgi:hypothetical protein